MDVIVGGPLTEHFLLALQWNGADAFAQADRNVWKIKSDDVEVAGFVRKSNNFTQVNYRVSSFILCISEVIALDSWNRNKLILYSKNTAKKKKRFLKNINNQLNKIAPDIESECHTIIINIYLTVVSG